MARNKILSSQYCTEINERLARGEKPGEVAEWYNNLPDIEYTISPRTFSRHLSTTIQPKDKIKARYNKRKAEKKSKEVVEQQVENIISTEETSDAFTESRVDELEIIDTLIKKLGMNIDITKMNDYQKGQLLNSFINTKTKMVGQDIAESADFSLFNFFTDDDGDILDDVRDTDE